VITAQHRCTAMHFVITCLGNVVLVYIKVAEHQLQEGVNHVRFVTLVEVEAAAQPFSLAPQS